MSKFSKSQVLLAALLSSVVISSANAEMGDRVRANAPEVLNGSNDRLKRQDDSQVNDYTAPQGNDYTAPQGKGKDKDKDKTIPFNDHSRPRDKQ